MRQIGVVLWRLRTLFGGTPDDRDLAKVLESQRAFRLLLDYLLKLGQRGFN